MFFFFSFSFWKGGKATCAARSQTAMVAVAVSCGVYCGVGMQNAGRSRALIHPVARVAKVGRQLRLGDWLSRNPKRQLGRARMRSPN